MTVRLYQFMISHYCERSRWNLDYKQVDFQLGNWVPGPHIRKAKKLGFKRSSVPILDYHGERFQGSDNIARFLEEKIPQNPLWPEDPKLAAEVDEWTQVADKEIGIPLRAILYGELIKYRGDVIDLWCQDNHFGNRLLCHLLFPTLKKKLTYFYKLEQRPQHEQTLAAGLERFDAAYSEREFLVGDRFTFADLSFAALSAPLALPPQHQVNWTEPPPELVDFFKSHESRPAIKRTLALYRDYRGR
ncbi:glutathione S-transferase family protein [Acanthopleuribacter pedis]|uniref:Glutathione S-transferase family protein n=1 Tax=Acanthopleuribacter pedis TaxID=442870 RepID=A0A8J7U5H9_9BACT|nr:glutathione S-transferase family protein [Acanthopleuribacter pedis]MBO1322578.1 glutathione S-transferase family protein [Acanthopleuribacter pedis]